MITSTFYHAANGPDSDESIFVPSLTKFNVMQLYTSSKSSLPVDLFFTIFSLVVIYSASPWILDQFHQALGLLATGPRDFGEVCRVPATRHTSRTVGA